RVGQRVGAVDDRGELAGLEEVREDGHRILSHGRRQAGTAQLLHERRQGDQRGTAKHVRPSPDHVPDVRMHGGGADAHEDLALAGRRLGDVAQFEVVDRAVAGLNDRLHRRAPAAAASALSLLPAAPALPTGVPEAGRRAPGLASARTSTITPTTRADPCRPSSARTASSAASWHARSRPTPTGSAWSAGRPGRSTPPTRRTRPTCWTRPRRTGPSPAATSRT